MKIIVILGYKLLKNGNMSNILIKRLNKAIGLYKKNDIFLVSGGKNQNTTHTEAYMMKKYIENILPNVKILTEAKSKTTIENIKYINPIINLFKCKKILITSKNHATRVKKILLDYDLNIKVLY